MGRPQIGLLMAKTCGSNLERTRLLETDSFIFLQVVIKNRFSVRSKVCEDPF